MKGFRVSLSAFTASMRDPGGQLYHSCLPLPPFSTLVGVAGAAMGMTFEQAMQFFRSASILTGVIGRSSGNGRDLWKYNKIAGPNDVKGDIVNREFLSGFRVNLFYASDHLEVMEKMRVGFLDPVYCLTLGSSDDLAVIHSVSSILDNVLTTELSLVKDTLVFSDISGKYDFDWESIKSSPVSERIRGPLVKKLPVDYVFDGRRRKASRYETFSFVTYPVRLRIPITVHDFGDHKVPMFSLEKE